VYWFSISFTSVSASLISCGFCVGIACRSRRTRCRARGDAEARLHELVGEDHGLAQPAAAEARFDEAEISFFLRAC
jgi:hypothetical protein